MIRFSCPSCKTELARATAGEKFSCPICEKRIRVPAPRHHKTVLGTLVTKHASREALAAKPTQWFRALTFRRIVFIAILVGLGAGLLVSGMESSYLFREWNKRETITGLEFIIAIAAVKGAGVGLLAGAVALLLLSVLPSNNPPER